MKNFLVIFLILTFRVAAQSYEFKGKILDSNNNPLPNASVLLAGTNQGTVSNLEGAFTFKLSIGKHTLITRYVGYKKDTVSIFVPQKSPIIIKLIKQVIELPEVIVTDEDPAYGIIREAIKRKKINKKGLKNFEYNAYSKKIVESSGETALVEEAFIKGYNNLPEWEKEFILKIHKTENRKKEIRSMDFSINNRYYLDFSEDTLNILMNKVYLPLAENAFDYYDYKLLNTIKTNGFPIYTIQVIPRSDIQPLLEGTINIEGEIYAICNVNLSESKGLRFPYIQDLVLRFKQSLGNYSGYWLPDYVETKASFIFNLSGLIGLDKLSFDMISIITGYKINEPIPDSVVNAKPSKYGGFTSDTSKNYKGPLELTDNEIKSLRPIPLTNAETEAFATLDSTKTLEKIIKPTGLFAGFVNESSNDEKSKGNSLLGEISGIAFDYSYLNINRVEKLTFGVNYSGDLFGKRLTVKSFAGYSVGIKIPLGSLSINYGFKNFFISQLDFNIFYNVKEWQEMHPYSHLLNSASVLLGFDDPFNYYLSGGFKFSIMKRLSDKFLTSLNFSSEHQLYVKEKKYFSIFNRNRFLRTNPEINEGFDKKISLMSLFGKSPFEFSVTPENGAMLKIESSSKLWGSDFSYHKIFFAGEISTRTIYKELFVAPYLQLNIEAVYIKGRYGIQHILTPITVMGIYSPVTSLKGLKPYQYVGDKMLALHLEHNWRTIIFQSLGLDFLTNLNLDIVTGASGLFISNDSKYFGEQSQKPYWETYIGISRIFAILRIDFSYNSQKHFYTTLSTATIF